MLGHPGRGFRLETPAEALVGGWGGALILLVISGRKNKVLLAMTEGKEA